MAQIPDIEKHKSHHMLDTLTHGDKRLSCKFRVTKYTKIWPALRLASYLIKICKCEQSKRLLVKFWRYDDLRYHTGAKCS